MGPTGAGKTTIGSLLASQLGWEFVDGDDFHPTANVEKMKRGLPLNDADREPWLDSIRKAMLGWIAEKRNIVLACSALKRAYRDRLAAGPEVKLVYLKGSYDLLRERLQRRHGHFANEAILAGQFADLEEPEDAVTVDVSSSPEEIVAQIRGELGLT